jgi:HEAT repeat protein
MKTTKTAFLTLTLILAPALFLCAQAAPKKAAKPAVKKAAPAPAAKPAPSAVPAAAQQPAAKPAAAAPAKKAADPFADAAEKLKATDPAVRRQGADFLGSSRDQKAVPYLVKALSDEAPAVRSSAIDGLCQLTSRESTKKISELLLQDKDALVRQQAASSLSYMADQSAGPALVKALKDDAPAVRYAAANTLGAMRYAPAEDALISLLADASMRRVAISALGQLQSKKAAAEIFKSLADQDKYTRLEAVRALGAIGDKSAAPELEKRLDRAEEPSVRVEAALALAKMGLPGGLVTAYEFVKSGDMSLKNQALEVIGAVGDARSLQFIEELYTAEKDPVSKGMLDFTRQRLAARKKMQGKQP